MGVLPQSIRSDKRNVNCLFGLGDIYEVATAATELHFLIFSDSVLLRGEFHFAQVDYSIIAVN